MIKNSHQNTNNVQRGFTLVESLVAIAILVTAVSGTYSAAQSGISSAVYSKNQITAFYLAQEAVEQIRNIRDQNSISGSNWLAGLAADPNDPCYFGKVCKVDAMNDISDPKVSTCSGGAGSCPVLRQNVTTGFIGHNMAWTPTTFKREVTLTQINQNEVAITVTIYWSKGVTNQSFKVRENILNWQ